MDVLLTARARPRSAGNRMLLCGPTVTVSLPATALESIQTISEKRSEGWGCWEGANGHLDRSVSASYHDYIRSHIHWGLRHARDTVKSPQKGFLIPVSYTHLTLPTIYSV